MKAKKLGQIQKTSRGFEYIEFQDLYGAACSLQASSLAILEQPGTSAVWLGCEKETIHQATGEPIGARMHLSRKQVESLIIRLQSWLDKGTFNPH